MPAGEGSGNYGSVEILWNDLIAKLWCAILGSWKS